MSRHSEREKGAGEHPAGEPLQFLQRKSSDRQTRTTGGSEIRKAMKTITTLGVAVGLPKVSCKLVRIMRGGQDMGGGRARRKVTRFDDGLLRHAANES